jgi:hypothetical protein
MKRLIARLLLLLAFALVTPVPAIYRNTPEKPAQAPREETVSFNVKSHKFHCPSCRAARACTRNCIALPKSEALRRGGVACKICGGTCR